MPRERFLVTLMYVGYASVFAYLIHVQVEEMHKVNKKEGIVQIAQQMDLCSDDTCLVYHVHELKM